MDCKRVAKAIYDKYIDPNLIKNNCHLIARKNGPYDYTKYVDSFRDLYCMTSISKYLSFQFRLLHNAILTNVGFIHLKVVESDHCFFCKTDREMVKHLPFDCLIVRGFWKDVISIIKGIQPGEYGTNMVKYLLQHFT